MIFSSKHSAPGVSALENENYKIFDRINAYSLQFYHLYLELLSINIEHGYSLNDAYLSNRKEQNRDIIQSLF